MMEKIPWMQRANKEVVATLSTEAGTHGKGSTPSVQADRLDLNSISIKPTVFLLFFLNFFKRLKTKKPCSGILMKKKKFKSFCLSMTKELF